MNSLIHFTYHTFLLCSSFSLFLFPLSLRWRIYTLCCYSFREKRKEHGREREKDCRSISWRETKVKWRCVSGGLLRCVKTHSNTNADARANLQKAYISTQSVRIGLGDVFLRLFVLIFSSPAIAYRSVSFGGE